MPKRSLGALVPTGLYPEFGLLMLFPPPPHYRAKPLLSAISLTRSLLRIRLSETMPELLEPGDEEPDCPVCGIDLGFLALVRFP